MNDQDRVEKLLALILLNQLKGISGKEKAVQLNHVGFSNIEIADLLDTNTNVIKQYLYEARKGRRSTRGNQS